MFLYYIKTIKNFFIWQKNLKIKKKDFLKQIRKSFKIQI